MFSISKDHSSHYHLKTGSVLLFWPKKFSMTAMPVVKPNVGKMSTMIQRYQKLLIIMEWFSVDLLSEDGFTHLTSSSNEKKFQYLYQWPSHLSE